jgi:hypothetical protein
VVVAGLTTWLPEIAAEPDQPPDFTSVTPLEQPQLRVELCPAVMLEGVAVKVKTGVSPVCGVHPTTTTLTSLYLVGSATLVALTVYVPAWVAVNTPDALIWPPEADQTTCCDASAGSTLAAKAKVTCPLVLPAGHTS